MKDLVMKKLTSLLVAAAALSGVFGASNTFAASTWTFAASGGNQAGGKVTETGTDPAILSLKGIYAANNAANTNFASANTTWATGTLSYYPGIGMTTGQDSGSPYHALDNNENTEAVVFNFANSVALTSIGLSYVENTPTVDLSVFVWLGAGSPVFDGKATSTAMSGWTLVGNYGDMAMGNNTLNNTGAISSSWWLVSAYNTAYGGSGLDQGNDYFKISSLTGYAAPKSTAKVPEPASLALVAVGLLGIAGARRRSSKKAADAA